MDGVLCCVIVLSGILEMKSKGLILVTNNMNDFRSVPGLRLENWAR